MIDIKLIRDKPELIKEALERRGADFNIDNFLKIDSERRRYITEIESLKHRVNEISDEVARKKRDGSDEEIERLRAEGRNIGKKIEELQEGLGEIEDKMNYLLYLIPNIPHSSVVEGKDSSQNLVLKTFEEKPRFSFTPKPHWEIGEGLGIVDFKAGTKIAGSGFSVMKKEGALLERALINFMLELHRGRGYSEVWAPFVANLASMTGTGQMPKFAEDMYKIEKENLYLIPTAEVSVTNLHRDEILDRDRLPLKYVAYSPCFRLEAGSYGKDVRGIIRQHQFNKVELVKFVEPETSYDELESLLLDAEEVLRMLKIHYRVVSLCTGDLGFASAKTYDIEVWLPGQNEYKEISSCSNFEDFQARRANIKYRAEPDAKPRFVHTLNGSGLAVGRTVVAILENYQQADGSVVIPEVLVPYMGGVRKIG